MSRQVMWTHELRCLVYRTLVTQFGPHNQWETVKYPKGKMPQYKATLKVIAKLLSQLTGTTFAPSAVRQQVDWSTSNQDAVTSQGYCRQFILNKAAALESGFLASNELPHTLAQD